MALPRFNSYFYLAHFGQKLSTRLGQVDTVGMELYQMKISPKTFFLLNVILIPSSILVIIGTPYLVRRESFTTTIVRCYAFLV